MNREDLKVNGEYTWGSSTSLVKGVFDKYLVHDVGGGERADMIDWFLKNFTPFVQVTCEKEVAPFTKEHWYHKACEYLTELQDMTAEKIKLEQQLKEAEKVIDAIDSIEAKYIDNPKVTYRDYHLDSMEICEGYLDKYKGKEQQ